MFPSAGAWVQLVGHICCKLASLQPRVAGEFVTMIAAQAKLLQHLEPMEPLEPMQSSDSLRMIRSNME